VAGIVREGGRLFWDHVSLEEAGREFGTPLYVYSREALVSAYAAFDAAFAAVPHAIHYALKANATLAILRVLSSLGAGADIVSGGELEAALRAGFPPSRIVFSGVGKTDEELRLGLARGVGVFNVESEEEILRLDGIAREMGAVASVSLRVNPAIDPRSHPYISTGLRESKFGVEIAQAPRIVQHAHALPGVRIVGMQCHIGSQVLDLEPMAEAASALGALSRQLLREGIPLETVDLGGGLGLDYAREGESDPVGLAARVLPALGALPLTLLLEPGRALVGAAGVLLTKVVGQKENGGRRFVIVDAGMNDLVRPALYGAFHRVDAVLSRGGPTSRVDVVGPVCETADFLARDRDLEPVAVGDLLAVRDVGAYGFSMSSRYNMRPRAAEVLIEKGRVRLVRRRENFDDLVSAEVD
jgi:diaminopimelate decarboxylase